MHVPTKNKKKIYLSCAVTFKELNFVNTETAYCILSKMSSD